MCSYIMILNQNMIFWTPMLEYRKIRPLLNSKLSPICSLFLVLNESQQERKLRQVQQCERFQALVVLMSGFTHYE